MDKKLRIILAALTLALGQLFLTAQPSNAFTLLTTVSDTIASISPGLYPVYHDLRFTLPYGEEISSTNYILIAMPYYTMIDISKMNIYGSFVYGDSTGMHASINGHTIVITNVSVVQGSTISISEFSAQNPNAASQFGETLTISNDSAGTSIIDSASFNPIQLLGKTSTVTATVIPYDAQMDISGYAYPGLFITITENGSVLATTTPDAAGHFAVQLTGLSPGTHNFSIYGVDSNNNDTAVSTLSLFGTAYQVVNYTNLILSPIVTVSPNQINQGDSITFSGESVPSSSVTLSINSPLTQLTTTADSSGIFSYTYSQTSSMTPGQYTVDAITQTQSSYQSIASPQASFTVLATTSSQPGPSCDISKGDLNCDGSVNIYDFSILLYNWGSNNPQADINGDGIVNLYDFSILMYNYTL